MELQKNINDNIENVLEYIKNQNLKIVKKKNLILIKYNYGDNINENWKKYCKGCVLDKNNNYKIVCLPPIKSDLYDKEHEYTDGFIVQKLIDGTMVNMFYYDDKWNLSTRSDIGGKNRWNKNTIEYLFKQCCDYKLLTESLNKKFCYCFVMEHKSIRNILPVEKNIITLVDKYNMETLKQENLNDILQCNIITNIENDNKSINEIINKYKNVKELKGLTFKFSSGTRVNYINEDYTKIENINVNSQNKLYKFIELNKNGNINMYLENYKEDKELFDNFLNTYEIMCDKLVINYHDFYIHKKIEIKDIDYQLRPIIYLINSIYHQTKKYMSKNNIKSIVNNLDTKRLVFMMKYYI